MRPDLFDEELQLPSTRQQQRLDGLVGLDEVKESLSKNAAVLLDPAALRKWASQHHQSDLPIVRSFGQRTPLFVFAGDVGTGKSTLAETFAQKVATDHNVRISVLRLSLRSRGTGAVGEMTRLLGEAFDEVVRRARTLEHGGVLVVVIDEADAIAQSRELGQMHHEDRAGVNALIRGIDTLAAEGLPALVVMCTNRLAAIDPAVRRRAAVEFEFTRPDEMQRMNLLNVALEGCGIDQKDLRDLAQATGDQGNGYGHTYSDLTNRVLPGAVLHCFPDSPLSADAIRNSIRENPPTPPFQAE